MHRWDSPFPPVRVSDRAAQERWGSLSVAQRVYCLDQLSLLSFRATRMLLSWKADMQITRRPSQRSSPPNLSSIPDFRATPDDWLMGGAPDSATCALQQVLRAYP